MLVLLAMATGLGLGLAVLPHEVVGLDTIAYEEGEFAGWCWSMWCRVQIRNAAMFFQ